ncbi:hypothetical protein DEO72_LG8g1748 [Vigna unguiculata]|uniref:Uncharacterized protein n=1 Tax=Vigna unguiculata TaxID=3917 RepID=A0A4D6MQN6_VIGUN|nr:hypothetical protein DEO72_LG8g1748 [Vigna unguiculata]
MQHHLLPCTTYTIIAKHKQIGDYPKVTCCHTYRPQLIEHVQETIVTDHTPTLTPTKLANPSSTQGFLVFIRHPELNSRDAIWNSTRGMPRDTYRQALPTSRPLGGGRVPPGANAPLMPMPTVIAW